MIVIRPVGKLREATIGTCHAPLLNILACDWSQSSGILGTPCHVTQESGHVTRALLRLERTMNLLCH